jgi:hypothetical protein
MAMWAVQGIGLLVNTIQGIAQQRQQNAQLSQMAQQNMAAANKLKAGMDKGLNIKPGGIMGGPSTSIYVDYPEKAFDNLHKLQTGNLSEKMGLESNLRKDFGELKNNFYKENHLKTEFGAKGKGEVVLDDTGKPQVMKGPESADQRAIRENYEAQNRLQLANKHAEQMDQFTKAEAEKCKAFLQNKAGQLNDPAVQNELQKMIVEGKKKALKIQQDQEEERWRADMPPSEEIEGQLQLGLNTKREMENRHVESEEKSPDHQQILDYNREFAAAAAEEKNVINAKKSDDNFLLDPRKMMAMATAPPKQRFDEVLPGHLTESLFQLGIYQV